MSLGWSPAALAAVRARLQADNPQRVFDDADAEEQRQVESKLRQARKEQEGSDAESDEEAAREAAEAARAAALRAERRRMQEERNARKKEKQEQAKIKQEQALAINFAKRLAHNEKKVRDASVKSLRRWLLKREQVADTDLLKIWKGLFYCFWMSDKVPVQQQLADNLSDLLLPPLPFDRALLFFHSFLITMTREWTSIDQLRMDKFMSLARRVLQKQIAVLQAEKWEQDKVEQLTDLLVESELFTDQTGSRGFSFHLIDCFLAEVERVSAAQPQHAIPFAALNTLLTPFYHILALCRDQSLVERAMKEVFEPLQALCATPSQSERQEQMQDGEPEDVQGLAADFPHIHAVVRGNADQISQILFSLAADPDLLPRSRKLLYSLRASFDESHRLFLQPAEEFAEDEELPALPGADSLTKKKKTKGMKRKAEAQDEEGEEEQTDAAPKKAKKLNKRQRLLAKRRKKEALLGAEPGAALEKQLRERIAQQAAEEEAQEDAGEEAEFADADAAMDEAEEEQEQVPSPPAPRKRKSQMPAPEQAEDETPAASSKKNKQAAAKSSKAATKRAMQSTIEEEPEEPLQEREEAPISPPKKKKARSSTAPASASTPSMPTRAPPPTPATGVPSTSSAPSAASPSTPPKAPAAGFTTPQSKSKTPRTKQGASSPNGASTPAPAPAPAAAPPALSTPLPSALRTPAASLAPPSSVKKSIRIDLSANKVRQFNRWSREEIREETSVLLAKSPTASLIKPSSIDFFIKHNKNGRELAQRQKSLTQQINEAADSGGESDSDSKKRSLRAKAADFFFEEQDSD